MKKSAIILIGGGGHCKSCIDVIEQENKYSIAGIIDVKEKVGQKIVGYPIIGTDEELPELAKKYDNFFITIGQLKDVSIRVKLFNTLKSLDKTLPILISPQAYVSKHATIEEGTIIMNGVIINVCCKIGKNNIINSKALIEHDTTIGNHCHISTGAIVNGECKISNCIFIGSRSVLNHCIEIQDDTIIGAGSVVINNLSSGKYVGNPAKKL